MAQARREVLSEQLDLPRLRTALRRLASSEFVYERTSRRDIPYHCHEVDLKAGEHKLSPFLAVNPFAKVPALTNEHFEPRPEALCTSSRTARFCSTWRNTTATTSSAPCTGAWQLSRSSSPAPHSLAIALFVSSSRGRDFPGLMRTLDALRVPDQPLVGGCWGTADCVVLAHLAYLLIFLPDLDLTSYPSIQARPVYRRDMGSP